MPPLSPGWVLMTKLSFAFEAPARACDAFDEARERAQLSGILGVQAGDITVALRGCGRRRRRLSTGPTVQVDVFFAQDSAATPAEVATKAAQYLIITEEVTSELVAVGPPLPPGMPPPSPMPSLLSQELQEDRTLSLPVLLFLRVLVVALSGLLGAGATLLAVRKLRLCSRSRKAPSLPHAAKTFPYALEPPTSGMVMAAYL